MSRAAAFGRQARLWWLHLALALGPLLALLLWGFEIDALAVLATPLYIAALLSMFVTLPLFRRYKFALIAAGKARDTADEPAAWAELALARRNGAYAAGLPAWIGALACFTDLSGVALILLGVTSLLILWLYRLPRQLL
ncbi:MFS transporter [Pseudomonas citronellolis]|uniref:MFS transporter n=1 Tax=Pseudomonas citronellolis TaxID=53408 RepID=UPI0023E383EF|nr:MFS transporter [Pseudomonas citronellolis]MDF3931501.1 MFS transporter [Pseudomonas citronellolis]